MNFTKPLSAIVLAFMGFVLCASAQTQRTATAIPTVVNGFLVAITVTDGGAGYTAAPTVRISGGGGSGAVAIAMVLNGVVDKVIVTNAGSGYTGAPTVSIDAPPSAKPPFSDGLVAYYPFNGNANDESANGNNPTLIKATLAPDRFAAIKSCYLFNGTSDYIEIPSSPSLEFGNQITLSAWVSPEYLRPLPGADEIIVKGYDLQAPMDWTLTLYNNKVRQALMLKDWTWWDSQTNVVTKVWQHVVFTYDAAKTIIYLNGIRSSQQATSGPFMVSHAPVRIGAYAPLNGTITRDFFPGMIDDIRIYNRALSDQEVKDLYRYEAPERPSVTIEVKTVQVTMHVKPTKTYQLQASLDLKTWTNIGGAFLAVTSDVVQEFNAIEVGRYFWLYEVQ